MFQIISQYFLQLAILILLLIHKRPFLKKRILANTKINNFRTKLCNINWSDVLTLKNPNDSYNLFIKILSKIYDEFFPLKTIKVKKKSLLSPWMSRGLLKSSKQKQKLYNKFLKHKTYTNYKTYKNLFEKSYKGGYWKN